MLFRRHLLGFVSFVIRFFRIGLVLLLDIVSAIGDLLLVLCDWLLEGLGDLLSLWVLAEQVSEVATHLIVRRALHNNYNLYQLRV